MVPAGTPGLTVGPAYEKLGWHASDTHPVILEDVRVPEDHLLGVRGRGYAQFLSTLDDGRIAIAALGSAASAPVVILPATTPWSGTRSAGRSAASRRWPS